MIYCKLNLVYSKHVTNVLCLPILNDTFYFASGVLLSLQRNKTGSVVMGRTFRLQIGMGMQCCFPAEVDSMWRHGNMSVRLRNVSISILCFRVGVFFFFFVSQHAASSRQINWVSQINLTLQYVFNLK